MHFVPISLGGGVDSGNSLGGSRVKYSEEEFVHHIFISLKKIQRSAWVETFIRDSWRPQFSDAVNVDAVVAVDDDDDNANDDYNVFDDVNLNNNDDNVFDGNDDDDDDV